MEAIHQGLGVINEIEYIIIRFAIMFCDMIGVLVLMITVVKCLINYFKKMRHIRLALAQGIALALEFKLAGEVMRTVTAHDWSELLILGTIIAIRAAITLLIHMEIKAERTKLMMENEDKKNSIPNEHVHKSFIYDLANDLDNKTNNKT